MTVYGVSTFAGVNTCPSAISKAEAQFTPAESWSLPQSEVRQVDVLPYI